jgi:hypothetical protein
MMLVGSDKVRNQSLVETKCFLNGRWISYLFGPYNNFQFQDFVDPSRG